MFKYKFALQTIVFIFYFHVCRTYFTILANDKLKVFARTQSFEENSLLTYFEIWKDSTRSALVTHTHIHKKRKIRKPGNIINKQMEKVL